LEEPEHPYMLDSICRRAHCFLMVEVVATHEFGEWFMGLESKEASAVDRVVGLLGNLGVGLRFPYTSAINGSRHALRELRVQAGGKPLRVFYAFDPERQAVLLIGGDKTGDDRFYEEMVPRADAIFDAYLAAQAKAKKKEKKP
jgi:hypothetical protein